MASPYWNQQLAGYNNAAGNVATALMRRPLLRNQQAVANAKAQQLSAEVGEIGAKTDLYRSQTALTGARAQELLKKGALVEALERTAPLAEKAYAEGRFDDPALNEYLGATSALTGVNKGDLAKNMKSSLGTRFAAMGDTAKAAAVENPVSVANNAAKLEANPLMTVAPGAALVDRQTGERKWENPSAASKVEQFDTVTEDYPATEAHEEIVTPAKNHWFAKDEPAVTRTIPGTPARKVTRKIPRGGNVVSALEGAQPEPAAGGDKVLTPELAVEYLKKHGGDRAKAEQAAKQDGYAW